MSITSKIINYREGQRARALRRDTCPAAGRVLCSRRTCWTRTVADSFARPPRRAELCVRLQISVFMVGFHSVKDLVSEQRATREIQPAHCLEARSDHALAFERQRALEMDGLCQLCQTPSEAHRRCR